MAANKAVVSQKFGGMVTRSVYSEILYNLSITKNISQSLTRFGVETGQDLLVCFIIGTESDKTEQILSQIDGEMRPITELRNLSDLIAIRKAYKLERLDTKSDYDLLDNIVSRIATKNIVSF